MCLLASPRLPRPRNPPRASRWTSTILWARFTSTSSATLPSSSLGDQPDETTDSLRGLRVKRLAGKERRAAGRSPQRRCLPGRRPRRDGHRIPGRPCPDAAPRSALQRRRAIRAVLLVPTLLLNALGAAERPQPGALRAGLYRGAAVVHLRAACCEDNHGGFLSLGWLSDRGRWEVAPWSCEPGAPAALARLRSLLGTVEWSHRLLQPRTGRRHRLAEERRLDS